MEEILQNFSDFMWGTPLLVLLLGGGFYFMLYSRFLPFQYFGHAIKVLRGKYDNPDDPGDINHYEALASAIAATVGMGNISGVAVAITLGGPGALFWMWISAFFGIATKFFTCTLSIMYRGKDSDGAVQGGPMYVIMEGLGTKWKPLAVVFSIAGLFGCLPIFQANQLTQVIRDVFLIPNDLLIESAYFTNNFGPTFLSDLITGIIIVIIVSVVIFGGIHRIAMVAGKMVPFMVVTYVGIVMYIILSNITLIPESFVLIFTDAFTGNAVLGGVVGEVIRQGAKRAAFSNEAGIGTAPMMHGAAKTKEPVREGLVAMLGPAIDTLIVCTMTALAIIITGVWKTGDDNGVTLTASAFGSVMPTAGPILLLICVLIFSFSTLFSFSYYGTKCISFLFGTQYQLHYRIFYVATIIWGSVVSINAVINLIDGMYAVMAYPTMISALLLSPKVKEASIDYFKRMKDVDKEKINVS
ncbi:alanine/glycine:cation symporter family protein [Chondrinema litorale]|uniref:alanine/glycine:cation symporter family protein n=1 Tax=Chondrinema litorale TaxID=2994555 RepID=UPI003D6E024D